MSKRKRRVQKSQPRKFIHERGNPSVQLMEPLEARVLLTTLIGGDTFDYQDTNGKIIRVTLTGNAIIELIAASIDTSQKDQPLILGNMPGQLSGDRVGAVPISVYGGLGGASDAVRVIGTTSFRDLQAPIYSSSAQSTNIFQALAASATDARTWGVDVGSYTVNGAARKVLNLVEFNAAGPGQPGPGRPADIKAITPGSGLTRSFLQEATLGEDVLANAKVTQGNFVAAAMKDTSSIYAINQELINVGGKNQNLAVLYQLDLTTGTVLNRAVITNTSDNSGQTNVALSNASSLSFDTAGNLYFTTDDYDGQSTVDTSGFPSAPDVASNKLDPGLVRVSIQNANFGQFSNADVSLITAPSFNGIYEITYPVNGITYNSSTGWFQGTASADSSVGSTIFSLANVTGAGPTYGSVVQIQNEVTVSSGGTTASTGFSVRGLAYSTIIDYTSANFSDKTVLVGALQDKSGAGSYLAAINPTTGKVTPLSTAGSISDTVLGLTSVTSAGDTRPMIYSVNQAGQIIRGSTISLPTDVSGATTVINSQGAAVSPTDGQLYFVTRELTATGGTTAELDSLYKVNQLEVGRSRIQNSIQAIGANHFGQSAAVQSTVKGIAFNSAGVLHAVQESTTGSTNLRIVNTANSAVSTGVTLQLGDEFVTGVSGLAFAPDAPGVAYITAGSGSTSQIIRTNMTDGLSLSLGLLTNTTSTTAIPGQNIGDLSWNPGLIDPFTGDQGALIATDTAANKLIFIDRRLRFSEAGLFTIYVSQTDGDATLAIAEITTSGTGSGIVSTPFTGNSGSIAIKQSNIVLNVNTGIYTTISTPANSGTVFIGAKGEFNTKDDNGDVKQLLDVPYLSALLSESIGVRAGGIDDFRLYRDPSSPYFDSAKNIDKYIGVNHNLTPGFIVGNTLLDFYASGSSAAERLLGGGFGSVSALSASSSGDLFAISTFGLTPVIGRINTDTNSADKGRVDSQSIRDVTFGGVQIAGIYGMDFGDINISGVESLYAAVSLVSGGPATLVTIDRSTGAVTVQGQIRDVNGTYSAVDAMAVSTKVATVVIGQPQVRPIYAVVGNTIKQINPATGEIVRSATLTSADGSSFVIGSMDFDQFNNLIATDTLNGRLLDINMATFADGGVVTVGARTNTPAGSVRPTIGAITFNLTTNSYLGTDNATTITGRTVQTTPVDRTAGSAALMTFRNFNSSSTPTTQDIDSVLIDGTVTGRVVFSGSVDTFYAGWVITGNTLGNVVGKFDRTIDKVQLPANFYVGGDIGNLLVGTHIGTDGSGTGTSTNYFTGTDIVVIGRAGVIKSIGNFAASFDIQNSTSISGAGRVVNNATPTTSSRGYGTWSEIETQNRYINDNPGIAFREGRINNSAFYNDTIDTAQYLGSLRTGVGTGTVLQVAGILQNNISSTDKEDFYAVSLMAGQTITVYTESAFGVANVSYAVYDPDGRMITSDAAGMFTNDANNTQIRFTAQRPGRYTIGVFVRGGYESPTTFSHISDLEYVLTIQNAGDLALAALSTGGDAMLLTGQGSTQLWGVRRGDLGAIRSSSQIYMQQMPNYAANLNIVNGNLRSMVATAIGQLVGDFPTETSPFLSIANGGVGLIKSTSGGIRLNMDNHNRTGFGTTPANGISIGGNYQTIDSASDLAGSFYTRKGIGVIRAATVSNSTLQTTSLAPSLLQPTEFRLNTDSTGNDGIIDLISVSGDWGNIGDGGAGITTGPGGNVRYMVVGGTLWGDRFFGSPTIDPQVPLAPGQSFQFKDDSGNVMTLTPTGSTIGKDELGNAVETGNQLTILAYGIRGSGGSVLVELTTTGGVNVNGNGGEISKVTVEGVGASITRDEETFQLVVDSETVTTDGVEVVPIGLQVTGTGKIDIWDVQATTVDYITNNTGGEIVNVTATDVVTLFSAGTLGLARSSTGAEVNGLTVFDNSYPFVDQRYGIKIAHAINVSANLSLGNIIVTSAVANLRANADQINTSGSFEGIVGPVVFTGTESTGGTVDGDNSTSSLTTIFLAGSQAENIDIGEGLAPLMAGTVGNSGIFSAGLIRNITSNSGGNIWGAIISKVGIQNITLNNGSIINAEIATTSDFTDAIIFDRLSSIVASAVIGNITLSGNGGIIGSEVLVGNLLGVTVRSGFGIIESNFRTLGQGSMGNFTIDGLGLRNVQIIGGTDVGNVTVNGNGQTLNINSYSQAVRQSQLSTSTGYNGALFDPLFNTRITRDNDISLYISQTGSSTESGLIDSTAIQGNRNLGVVNANRITNSIFNFANYIAGINTRSLSTTTQSISGLQVTTGQLGNFTPKGDLSNLQLTVAGVINNINIQGSLLGGSKIAVVGPGAKLGTVVIKDDLVGDIYANGPVTSITVGGDLSGNITINPFTPTTTSLSSLSVTGSWVSGLIDISGSVNKIAVGGSFGTFGLSNLVIDGNLGTLVVGSLAKTGTALPPTLGAELQILGKAQSITVNGKIEGDITVRGLLTTLNVNATKFPVLLNSSIVTGDINALGGINTVTINGGDLASTISGGDPGIKTFTLTNGDMEAGSALTAGKGGIGTINIPKGHFVASTINTTGTINTMRVGGNVLDLSGSITAGNIKSLTLARGIAAGSDINVEGTLQTLSVAGSVAAGTMFDVGRVGSITTTGDFRADLTAGFNAAGTRLTTRNLAGNLDIDGNVTLTVKGNIEANSKILVRDDLKSLTVAGTIGGDVVPGKQATQIISFGSIGNLTAGSVFNTVITAGFDISTVRVSSTVNNTLIQAGISPGVDGVFDKSESEKDEGELTRPGSIKSFSAAAVNNSIINAGGTINTATIAGTLRDSSISSGLNLGSFRIRDVIDDPNLLAVDRAFVRTGTDRALFRGDINNIRVSGTLVNADVTAGVDAGADGLFGTADDSVLLNTVLPPYGGGTSKIGSFSGTANSTSNILADAGIGGNPQGGNINANITYDIADLGPLTGAKTVISASNKTVTIDGVSFTITGSGQLEVYDTALDNAVDSVVITGTNAGTKITISGGSNRSVGRIVSTDDAIIGTLNAYGVTISGTVPGSLADIWLEGATTVSLGVLGDAVEGAISGKVSSLTVKNQGAGLLRIDGAVSTLTVEGGDGYAIEGPLFGTLPGSGNVTGAAIDLTPAANIFYVRNGVLQRITNLGTSTGSATAVQSKIFDQFSGTTASGVDLIFTSPENSALALAYSRSYAPSIAADSVLNPDDIPLRSLAVNSQGQAYALGTINNQDVLIRINADGQAETVGILQDAALNTFNSEAVALAFDNIGRLLAVVHYDTPEDPLLQDPSRDGRHAIAVVSTTPNGTGDNATVLISSPANSLLLPQLLTLPASAVPLITSIAVQESTNAVYGIQRDPSFARDILINIGLTGQVTTVGGGVIELNGQSTNILGIGFDDLQNLVALNDTGEGSNLIGLKASQIFTPEAFTVVTEVGRLSSDLRAFATGRGGSNAATTYAYNPGTVEGNGRFYSGTGSALVATIGRLTTQGPNVGSFVPLAAVIGIDNNPVTSPAVAVAERDGFKYVALANGQLIKLDATGSTVAQGQLRDDSTNQPLIASDLFFTDSGKLVALDTTGGRFVFIDTSNEDLGALTGSRTEIGSVASPFKVVAVDNATGEVFSYNTSNNRILQLRGTGQDDLGGIVANSIGRLAVTGASTGRIASVLGSITTTTITGAFNGSLSTSSTLNTITVNGSLNGYIYAGEGIGSITINGGMGGTGGIDTNGNIASIRQTSTSDFSGLITARTLGNLQVSGTFRGGIFVDSTATSLKFARNFSGIFSSAGFNSLTVTGQITAGSIIYSNGSNGTFTANAGLGANALVFFDNRTNTINVKGTTSGMIVANGGFNTATFQTLSQAIITSGANSNSFTVSGDTLNSIISIGTVHVYQGAAIFNTATDRIVGATLSKATFSGRFTDSVLADGVLPNLAFGTVTPTTLTGFNNSSYIADSTAAINIGSPEIGGPVFSNLSNVTINGLASSTNTALGRRSVIVSADQIDKLTIRQGAQSVTTRVYDTLQSLQIQSATVISGNQIRVVFNQTLNPSSVVRSTAVGDNNGTVLLVNSGFLSVIDSTVTYVSEPQSNGSSLGVITITTTDPLPTEGFSLTLYGRSLLASINGPQPAPRSDLTNLIELRFIGNRQGILGGNATLTVTP